MASRPVIGSVAVSVVPSTERFADVLRAKLLGEADRIGDEVGDILKQRIEAKLGHILIPVKIDDALVNAKLDELQRKIDHLNGQRATIRVRSEESGRGAQGGGGILGWLVSLVAAAVALAPAFVVAGVGVSAFAALAVPQIAGVTKYLHDMNLGSDKAIADWAALNDNQRAVATELIQLRAEFKNVSNSISPQVLQVFDSVLSDINTILPELVPLAKAGANALAGFFGQIGSALSDSQAQEFFNFVAKNIGPDMQLIGQTVVALIHTIFNLTESLQPVSLGLLHVINLFAELLQWTSKNVPWLNDIVVLAIALYKPLVALRALQLAKLFLWIPGAVKAFQGLILVMQGLTNAEKALFIIQLALDAISPWGWALIGAAALAGLITGVVLLTHSNEDLTASLAKQDKATGFNIAGYLKLADQLDGARGRQIAYSKAQDQGAGVASRYGGTLNAVTQAQAQVSQASEEARQHANNLTTALEVLQARYGITQQQAILLAKAAHVSGNELAAGGQKAQDALKKIELFGDANLKAHGPAHQFALDLQAIGDSAQGATNQIKGLTDAYNQMINPNLNAEDAVVTMKNDLIQMTDALKKSKGAIGDHTQAQRDSFSAFKTYITDIQNTESATLSATGAQRAHDLHVLQHSIPELLLLAKNNKSVRGEIMALIKTIQSIPPTEKVSVAVTGTGHWSIAELRGGIPIGGGNRLRAGAQGMRIPTNAGQPGKDSVVVIAKPGEAIVPNDTVPYVAQTLHDRGVRDFAQGGLVTGDINHLNTFTKQALSATVTDMALSVKDAILQGIKDAKAGARKGFFPLPGGGGPGGSTEAVARALFPWPASMWPAFNAVEMREAGYSLTAQNPSSGAYGVAQFINGPSEYYQYGGNPFSAAGQFTAMFNYIRQRYGNPLGAWAHELAFGWYDKGGWLPSGAMALNLSGQPEPVLSSGQWKMLESAFANVGGGGDTNYNAYFTMPDSVFESRIRNAFSAMDMQASHRERVGRRA